MAKEDKFKRSRTAKEAKLSRKLARYLAATKRKILDLIEGAPANPIDELFWSELDTELGGVIKEDLILAGYEAIDVEMAEIPFLGIDLAVANAQVNEFISSYAFDLVKGINSTSRKVIQGALDSYFTGATTIGEVQTQLIGTFGASRAEAISVTEITRAFSAGQTSVINGLEDIGLGTVEVWNTNNDDLVCPTCEPLNDKVKGKGWDSPPPAHVRCRCWRSVEIKNRRKAFELAIKSVIQAIN